VARAPEEAFAFFADPWNLEAITPRWLRFRIVEAPEEISEGAMLRYRLRLFGIPIGWRTEIVDWSPPRAFTDVQRRGPYPLWEHTHRVEPAEGGAAITDDVRYGLPGGPLEPLVHAIVRRWLDAIFDFRAERLRELLDREPQPLPPA
jgi:ligand-binding SRPBCC domain-containing protein